VNAETGVGDVLTATGLQKKDRKKIDPIQDREEKISRLPSALDERGMKPRGIGLGATQRQQQTKRELGEKKKTGKRGDRKTGKKRGLSREFTNQAD